MEYLVYLHGLILAYGIGLVICCWQLNCIQNEMIGIDAKLDEMDFKIKNRLK